MARDPSGAAGPTAGEARGAGWRSSSSGLYVPSDVDAEHPQQRVVEAAAVLRGYGAVTGWAALNWLGGHWFDGSTARGLSLPVTLAVGGHNLRQQPGMAVSKERLAPPDLEVVDGLTVTSAVRSVCFEMRYAEDVRAAVLAVEMAAFSDLVSLVEMWVYALAHPGWTGIPQCRRALELADENVWSPAEGEMKQVWQIDAGLPRPLMNVPIFSRSGRHLATPDLLDPVAGVVGEYDGVVHLVTDQRRRDLKRAELYRSLRLEQFTMMAGDLAKREESASRMLAARRRALWLPESERTWTIDPPHWWTPTVTVEQRRALADWQKARFLAYRGA